MPIVNFDITADLEIVAAVAGRKIRVHAVFLRAAAGTSQFESGATLLIGPMSATTVLPWSLTGWGDTVSGEALNLDLSASDANSGTVVYSLISS